MSKNILKKSLTKINMEEQFKLSNISILFRQPYYHRTFLHFISIALERKPSLFCLNFFLLLFEKNRPFLAYVSAYILLYKLLKLAFKIIM